MKKEIGSGLGQSFSIICMQEIVKLPKENGQHRNYYSTNCIEKSNTRIVRQREQMSLRQQDEAFSV